MEGQAGQGRAVLSGARYALTGLRPLLTDRGWLAVNPAMRVAGAYGAYGRLQGMTRGPICDRKLDRLKVPHFGAYKLSREV